MSATTVRAPGQRVGEFTTHGSASDYVRGCRCRECKDAQSAYLRAWRIKDRAAKGLPPARAPRTMNDRFWSKVEKTDACWLWMGSRNRAGYGQFSLPARRMTLAHRWSYESLVGPIPKGLHLDHLCRVRNCVNPNHLEPVTPRENNFRGIGWAPARAAQTHCIHGHAFDVENTYYRPNGTRMCKKCNSRRNAEIAARKKQKAVEK